MRLGTERPLLGKRCFPFTAIHNVHAEDGLKDAGLLVECFLHEEGVVENPKRHLLSIGPRRKDEYEKHCGHDLYQQFRGRASADSHSLIVPSANTDAIGCRISILNFD